MLKDPASGSTSCCASFAMAFIAFVVVFILEKNSLKKHIKYQKFNKKRTTNRTHLHIETNSELKMRCKMQNQKSIEYVPYSSANDKKYFTLHTESTAFNIY